MTGYINEDDKAFGLAGMAIAIAALDGTDRVAYITLDTDGPMVSFANEFYYSGSPSVSPKAAWSNLLHNYYLTSSLTIANLLARSMVRMGKSPESEVLGELHDAIISEGVETCSLEEDEAEGIYRKSERSMRNIFANPRVHPAVKELVHIISARRRLSGTEILEELARLGL